jgi:hypothetical protein
MERILKWKDSISVGLIERMMMMNCNFSYFVVSQHPVELHIKIYFIFTTVLYATVQ